MVLGSLTPTLVHDNRSSSGSDIASPPPAESSTASHAVFYPFKDLKDYRIQNWFSAKRTSSNVAAGSVWESSRTRIDQVRGGIKVFSGGAENLDVDDIKAENRASEQTNRSSPGLGLAEKRQACKSESNSIQIVGKGDCKSSAQFQRKKSASDNDDQRRAILISKSRSDLKLSKNRDSLEANGLDRDYKQHLP